GPGEPDAPQFGHGDEVYNVIDSRQAYLQHVVVAGLRALGHGAQADHSTHFSYEMVALTPRAAQEMGYTLSAEEEKRAYVEMSGRRGLGVKADDLIDQLEEATSAEVAERHPQLPAEEQEKIAHAIAIGALRYFLLKFTRNSVISFDFKEALSFEGDSGPYCQYAVVRASNIFRKGGLDPDAFCLDLAGGVSSSTSVSSFTSNAGAGGDEASLVSTIEFAKYLNGESGNDIWELWLSAAKTSYIVSQCIATTEPAYLAKHAFQLAQLFNTFYHRYPILSEADEGRRKFLLTTTAVVRRELIRVLAIMGITVPPVM